jgi:hypothetical protein
VADAAILNVDNDILGAGLPAIKRKWPKRGCFGLCGVTEAFGHEFLALLDASEV